MKKQWVCLHNHTVNSLLDGYGHIKKYMERAAMLGQPALAITDHGNLFGWLDFYREATEAGIKPILGIEAYQARKTRFDHDDEERAGKANDELEQRGPYHLTLLARNEQGYKNLIKLSSYSYLEGFYGKPRIDHELIGRHSDGLIILSGCLNGEVQQALLRNDEQYALHAAARWQEMVGRDNFYMEIMDHGLPEQKQVKQATIDIAKRLGARLVPTGDCHYAVPEDANAHDAMLCLSVGATINDEKRFKFYGPDFYLKSYDEMVRIFPDEWLSNTLVLTESVDVELNFGKLFFPEFALPNGEDIDSFLERHVYAGLRLRYGDPIPKNVLDRAEHELRVVRRMGFQSYFLVVWDIIRWAKEAGIRVGWGRGSAAGSILSYALRITNLDPIAFGLMFERFLVEGRKSMPDIDLDIDDRYREKVIDYARSKYGSDHVAHIITFSTIGARAAIRDSARVLGKEYIVGDKLAKAVPLPVLGISKTLKQALDTPDLKKLVESDRDSREVITTALQLEGLIRQTGIHAAGVVISQGPVTDYVPLMLGGSGTKKNIVVTPWDMHKVEQCGLLKIDFLGLRNLNVIDRCLETIGNVIDLDNLPLDDADTYKNLKAGHSVGVFQLESPGMREMMVALQPSTIEDIMALISLYRPGPLDSKMDKLYISRKHGRAPIETFHPKLKEVLADSYGIMLYQEDVLAVAQQLAGFSIGEADDLRKAIGKKEMDKIGKFRGAFVEGCRKVSGVKESLANQIYSYIEKFGGYGFNRAHAASYAMISYVTAMLKFNYPAEYMAALLSTIGEQDRAAPYLNECRRLGVRVLPPSINKSATDFRVISDEEILFGFSSIRGIGPAIVDAINKSRKEPYTSIYDFMRRTDTAVLNKAALEHLTYSGALDELAPVQPTRLLNRDEKLQLLDLEKHELGLYVSDHPLLGVWHMIEPSIDCTILDLETKAVGDHLSVGGLITSVTKRKTKRGEHMLTLVLEDLTGPVDVVVFPRDTTIHKDTLKEGSIVILQGRLQREGDDEYPITKLLFADCNIPDLPEYGGGTPIVLQFPETPSHGIISKMEDLIETIPGDSPVLVEFWEGRHKISLKFKKPTSYDMKESLELLCLKEMSSVI